MKQATAEQVAMFFLQQQGPMKIYLAGPFFNPKQVNTIKTIEEMLDQMGLLYFSPRKGDVVLKDLTFEERAVQANKVYKENVDHLDWCDVVLAVIDDRDPGTYWELGYGFAKGKRLVTYTAYDYGLNVMLQEAVTAHVTKLHDLVYLLEKGLPDEICALYRVFHQATT